MRQIVNSALLGLLLICAAGLGSSQAQTATEPVTLVFAGDIVLDDVAGAMIERGQDPFAAFGSYFRKADIRIGNLECVVATTGSAGDKNFTFRAHPRTLPVLKRHFDALALANNHSGDYGREAFAEMLRLLPAAGLQYFGGGHNLKEAHAPLIIERKGLRIALLGGQQKPVIGAGRVGRAPLALQVQDAQVELGQRVALVCCELVPLACQREILGNVLP